FPTRRSSDLFEADDLPDLGFAVNALGWRLEIVFDEPSDHLAPSASSPTAKAMVMRLRHGRGRTQTQIPLRVFDGFFAGSRTLRDRSEEHTSELQSRRDLV